MSGNRLYVKITQLTFLTIFLLTAIYAKISYIYGQNYQAAKKTNVIRLFLPNLCKDANSFNSRFSENSVLQEVRKKKVIRVELTGDYSEDYKRFSFIRSETQRLKYSNDTTTIMQVHFTNENSYGQFVYLISFLLEDHQKRYALVQNDLYIFGEKNNKTHSEASIHYFIYL